MVCRRDRTGEHVVFRVPISDQAIVIVALRLPSMDGTECDSKDPAPHIGLLLSEMPVQGLGKQRTLAFSGAPLHPLKAKADKIHEALVTAIAPTTKETDRDPK